MFITAATLSVMLTACSSGGGSSKAAKVIKTSPSTTAPTPTQTPAQTPKPTPTAVTTPTAKPTPPVVPVTPTPLPPAPVSSSAPNIVPFSAQPTSAAQAPGQATGAAGPTLLALSGTGSTSSRKYTAAANWAINYSFDCHNAPDNTNFQIFPTGNDPNSSVATVNQLTETGSGTQRYTTPGTYYLVVNTLCTWKLSVIG